jgi:hypothetical protein
MNFAGRASLHREATADEQQWLEANWLEPVV